jgi:hypothetical protein
MAHLFWNLGFSYCSYIIISSLPMFSRQSLKEYLVIVVTAVVVIVLNKCILQSPLSSTLEEPDITNSIFDRISKI